MNIADFPGKFKKIQNANPNTAITVVTKYFSPEDTKNIHMLALESGINDLHLAENRIQQAIEKQEILSKVISHFIWPLQSKKAKKAVEIFDVIESVDRLKLLWEINNKSKDQWKIQEVYLQVNISNESQKQGFNKGEVIEVMKHEDEYQNVKISGLMGMASRSDDIEVSKQFGNIKALFDELSSKYPDLQNLSIWMSSDYKLAIKNWATSIRLWTILFSGG